MVRLVDLGLDPRILDLAATFKQSAEREIANGYGRVREAQGRLIIERPDRTKSTVEQPAVFHNRLVLQVEGATVTEADLNCAMTALPDLRQEAPAKGGS
jgi:hypothetical protein